MLSSCWFSVVGGSASRLIPRRFDRMASMMGARHGAGVSRGGRRSGGARAGGCGGAGCAQTATEIASAATAAVPLMLFVMITLVMIRFRSLKRLFFIFSVVPMCPIEVVAVILVFHSRSIRRMRRRGDVNPRRRRPISARLGRQQPSLRSLSSMRVTARLTKLPNCSEVPASVGDAAVIAGGAASTDQAATARQPYGPGGEGKKGTERHRRAGA
jgi:hypothetical protein